jgi:hypothetical protein
MLTRSAPFVEQHPAFAWLHVSVTLRINSKDDSKPIKLLRALAMVNP